MPSSFRLNLKSPRSKHAASMALATVAAVATLLLAIGLIYPAVRQNLFSMCQGHIADLPEYQALISQARSQLMSQPCFSSIGWKTLLLSSTPVLLTVFVAFSLALFVSGNIYEHNGDKQKSQDLVDSLSVLVLTGMIIIIVLVILDIIAVTI